MVPAEDALDPVVGGKLNAEQYEEVMAYIRRREKIAAIKRYREITGEGLKECKDAVDALEKTL